MSTNTLLNCTKKTAYFFLFALTFCCSTDESSVEIVQIFNETPAAEVSIFSDATQDGYTLVTPLGGKNSFLLDKAGFVVHKYPSTKTTFMGYLKPNGNLVRAYQIFNPDFSNNGETGGIEIVDQEGQVIWTYEISNSNETLHHDIEILPNGNILALTWYKINNQDAIASGRNPLKLNQGEVHADRIIEIQPVGNNAAHIVWEWNSKNHFIQDFDSSKANFGNVNQNSGKIDLNYTTGEANHTHINGISYNAERDIIILSSLKFSEIWVLDHSTTTAEATTSLGGNSNRGGELLFRFGNPEAFKNGDSTDKILFGQHDPTYIENENSLGGNFLVFNNKVSEDESAAMEFSVPFVGLLPNSNQINNNLPNEPIWKFQSNDIFSPFISGAQRLANDNTLITVGRFQRIIEVNQTGNIVFRMDFEQSGSIFKTRKYPINYTGLPTNLERLPNTTVTNQ